MRPRHCEEPERTAHGRDNQAQSTTILGFNAEHNAYCVSSAITARTLAILNLYCNCLGAKYLHGSVDATGSAVTRV
jgi:hypothetical protein